MMYRSTPFDIGTVHFVGIGGIGMSGIAEVMHTLGYKVQGSDMAASPNVERLVAAGIQVMIGQKAENLGGARVVVISSAIKADNPEMQEAKRLGLPIVKRAEMLAELMRLKWTVSVAGTHGKTTTTSMVAHILDAAGFDPTVINGGIINTYGTNARLGEGDWMVVEADESDGTFVKLPATIAVVTNLDPEHLDFYGTFEAEKKAFQQFLDRVPFYGAAVLCLDHADVQALIPHVQNRQVITYGLSPQADVHAENLHFENGQAHFNVRISARAGKAERLIEGVVLPMPGNHNVQNALAAFAVADFMGSAENRLQNAFTTFKGVKRRFSHVGDGAGRRIIDDYGHHPVEIAAVLKAARASHSGRIVAVVQPHRYSRLKALFEDFCRAFNDADRVIVTPVYAAGEAPIEGFDRDSLAEGMRAHGLQFVDVCDGEDDLAAVVAANSSDGDMVICLGAGSISRWAHALPAQLDALATTQTGGGA